MPQLGRALRRFHDDLPIDECPFDWSVATLQSLVTIDVVDPATPDAQACLAAYFAELDERFDSGFDPERSLTAGVDEMRLPHGLFVVAHLHGEPVGCGGVGHVLQPTLSHAQTC